MKNLFLNYGHETQWGSMSSSTASIWPGQTFSTNGLFYHSKPPLAVMSEISLLTKSVSFCSVSNQGDLVLLDCFFPLLPQTGMDDKLHSVCLAVRVRLKVRKQNGVQLVAGGEERNHIHFPSF